MAALPLLLAACGGAAAPRPSEAPAPAADEAPAAERPSSAADADESAAGEEAERQRGEDSATWSLAHARAAFDRSERQLAALLPAAGQTRGGDFAEPPPAEVAGPSGDRPDKAGGAAGMSHRESRCRQACRALGSMQRAAGRLCQLAGQDDPLCVRVRERSEQARLRVQRACPRCASARPREP